MFALIGGYWLTVGYATTRQAIAHPVTMPATPYIIRLALDATPKGSLTPEKMQAENIIRLADWQAVQVAAQKRPLDALLIDAKALDDASKTDVSWLRARFDEGIVMVGIGVDDNRFAQFFGVTTFEGAEETALGPTEYRMVFRLAQGTPGDLAKILQKKWFQRLLENGEYNPAAPSTIDKLMILSSGIDRGDLKTDQDLHLFFTRLNGDIAGVYQARAEYQDKMQKGEGKRDRLGYMFQL